MTADVVYQIAETLSVSELKRLYSLISKDIQRINTPVKLDENAKLALHFRRELLRKEILKKPTARHQTNFFS